MMFKLSDFLIRWLNHEPKPHGVPLCDFERFRHELKPCDVILVEGRSRVSTVIRLVTASPWTHAALYIGRIHDIEDASLRESLESYCHFPANEQLIIESHLGKGTIVNQLSFYKKDHIRICRPSGLSYRDSQQVIQYAISRLGSEYDVRQIFDLARFLFPWFLLPRRWRSSLFKTSPGDSTRTVCSTMIAEAFGFIQFPILPLVKRTDEVGVQLFRRNPKLCVPSDFDYSPHFEIIKYPYIDVGFYKDYRLLPWKGSGSLSTDEAQYYFEHDEPSPKDKAAQPQPPTDSENEAYSPAAFIATTPLKRVAEVLPYGRRKQSRSNTKDFDFKEPVPSEEEPDLAIGDRTMPEGTPVQYASFSETRELTETKESLVQTDITDDENSLYAQRKSLLHANEVSIQKSKRIKFPILEKFPVIEKWLKNIKLR